MKPTELLTRRALIDHYHSYGKPREKWRVGGEFERLALRPSGKQVGYSETNGIQDVLRLLASRFRWEPVWEGSSLIGLKRGKSRITLEPGGQVELASEPYTRLIDLEQELRENQQELQIIGKELNITWAATGVSPFSSPDDVEWVPKGRYRIMREYLPSRGAQAPVMMKSTTSFQAAFDYQNEADCSLKTTLLFRLGPLTTALFANSPVRLGKDTQLASSRAAAWQQTDPDRTGFPEAIVRAYSHEAWVDYLIDAPMMFVESAGNWVSAKGMRFREFMDRGWEGRLPNWADWELHQTSVFPEVRVKHFIELRGADACPMPLAMAGIALFTGLLYDSTALEHATELAESFHNSHDIDRAHQIACESGLRGSSSKRPFIRWAESLFHIGEKGLSRIQPDAAPLLAPLKRLIEGGESPATFQRNAFGDASRRSDYIKAITY